MWIIQANVNGKKYWLQVNKKGYASLNGLKDNAAAYSDFATANNVAIDNKNRFPVELKPVPKDA